MDAILYLEFTFRLSFKQTIQTCGFGNMVECLLSHNGCFLGLLHYFSNIPWTPAGKRVYDFYPGLTRFQNFLLLWLFFSKEWRRSRHARGLFTDAETKSSFTKTSIFLLPLLERCYCNGWIIDWLNHLRCCCCCCYVQRTSITCQSTKTIIRAYIYSMCVYSPTAAVLSNYYNKNKSFFS